MRNQTTNAATQPEQHNAPVINVKGKTIIIPLGNFVQPQSAGGSGGDDDGTKTEPQTAQEQMEHFIGRHYVEHALMIDLATYDLQEALGIVVAHIRHEFKFKLTKRRKPLVDAIDCLTAFGNLLDECDKDVFREIMKIIHTLPAKQRRAV